MQRKAAIEALLYPANQEVSESPLPNIKMRYNRRLPGSSSYFFEVLMLLKRGNLPHRAHAAHQSPCEQLEARLLLSSSVRRGVLTIAATPGDDDATVFVSRTKITVFLNRASQSFSITGLKYIRFNGGDGDDWFGINGKFPVL